MDPIVSVVVGGLIAVGGGFVGAWIQGRREHKKWLREKRLEAYVPTIAFLTEYELILSGVSDHRSRVDGVIGSVSAAEAEELRSGLEPEEARAMEYRERVPREMAAITVLGPESLAQAVRQWEETSRTTLVPWFEVGTALGPIVNQIRKALDIKD
jgi:hypothetical protein